MSEKSIAQQQAGLVRRQKRAVGTPLISLGSALVANSLCRGQERRMMREREVQIGNSGFIQSPEPAFATQCADLSAHLLRL